MEIMNNLSNFLKHVLFDWKVISQKMNKLIFEKIVKKLFFGLQTDSNPLIKYVTISDCITVFRMIYQFKILYSPDCLHKMFHRELIPKLAFRSLQLSLL